MAQQPAGSASCDSNGHADRLLDPVREPRVSYGEVASWCLTGMSGWWALNVISAELPYFVAELPEGAGLGNLIAVCTQLGNIAPIAYKALHRLWPAHWHLTFVIGAFQILAVATLFGAALFWGTTIGGYSAMLLLLTALAGSVGCMSNVTYWAAANARPPACTRSMSVGTTLGGLLATGLSSLQMAGKPQGEPRFSPMTLFTAAGVVQVLMAVAFAAQARNHQRRAQSGTSFRQAQAALRGETAPEDAPTAHNASTISGLERGISAISAISASAEEEAERAVASSKAPLPAIGKLLLVALFLIYGATYTMPTVQPYMAGGYPDATERQQLLLAMLVLQNAGDVLGRMSTALIKGGGGVVLLTAWSVALVVTFFASVACAAKNAWVADALSYDTALWVLPALCGCFYFSRGLLVTALYLLARGLGDAGVVQRLSLDMGFYGQMGALIANAVSFVLVSVLHVL